jgi:hypothetical protein
MRDYTVIVTGVPRSGTSMTMRMLQFGGIDIWCNPATMKPTSFNKYGCFEKGDLSVDLTEYQGKAVKVLNPVVLYATPKFKYKVIIPIRDVEQILLSRQASLRRPLSGSERLRVNGALGLIKKLISERDDMEVLEIPYEDYFNDTTGVVNRIKDFLGEFDVAKAVTAVDHDLYKVRDYDS